MGAVVEAMQKHQPIVSTLLQNLLLKYRRHGFTSERHMRTTLLMEFNFHVKMHPHLAAPVAGYLADKASHNGAGDARCGALEKQIAQGVWNNRG